MSGKQVLGSFLQIIRRLESSNITFPTKETVCHNKTKEERASQNGNNVACPWKTPPQQSRQTQGQQDDCGPSYKGWKKFTLFICLPAVAILSLKVLLFGKHDEEKPEFVPYEYMRIRTTKFPWGDGNKSFFHNPRKNALPDGYENAEE